MTRINTTPYRIEQRVFFAALSLVFILFGLYIYFLSASVVHVIARKETDKEIAQVQSRIGDLESTYIRAKQAIATETIEHYGFVAIPATKIYVRKGSPNLVLLRP